MQWDINRCEVGIGSDNCQWVLLITLLGWDPSTWSSANAQQSHILKREGSALFENEVRHKQVWSWKGFLWLPVGSLTLLEWGPSTWSSANAQQSHILKREGSALFENEVRHKQVWSWNGFWWLPVGSLASLGWDPRLAAMLTFSSYLFSNGKVLPCLRMQWDINRCEVGIGSDNCQWVLLPSWNGAPQLGALLMHSSHIFSNGKVQPCLRMKWDINRCEVGTGSDDCQWVLLPPWDGTLDLQLCWPSAVTCSQMGRFCPVWECSET